MANIDVENVPVEDLLPHLDLFDPEHRKRLWETLAHARASSCPVIKTDADNGYYVITRYDDLRTVAGDPETFSSARSLRAIASLDIHRYFECKIAYNTRRSVAP